MMVAADIQMLIFITIIVVKEIWQECYGHCQWTLKQIDRNNKL
jgi:hypothetical protein